MEHTLKKPRLVFFQWDHSTLPNFLKLHVQQHAKCLSEFFDLILISRDCDYTQICDTYQPDLALFEGGYKSSFSKKISISNTSAYPQIPKLGFHNGDPWCDCRPGFLSEMDHWGIDTFFSISTTAAEHIPEVAGNLFIWPNFIDSDIYKDYAEPKTVQIMFTGSMTSLYPWRQKVHKLLTKHYPSLTLPHLGYGTHSPLMIYGEQYARSINASWIVPTCGTVVKEVVRKHFEVPGAKACLITEESPSLKAAGFIDMHNCIFADESDILDKVDYLLNNKTKLEEIISNGFLFVHSHHTFKQRDQLLQWFTLFKQLKGTEKIVQPTPFDKLKIVQQSSDTESNTIKCNGVHLKLFHEGERKLLAGEYDEAEALYLKCLDYIPTMSEAKIKIGICNLFKGNIENAFHYIIQPIHFNLGLYGAVDPDPVEWAYYIIYLICKGELNEAVIRSKQFPSLNHIELYRTRLVVYLLRGLENQGLPLEDAILKARYSIHQLPPLGFDQWIKNLCVMLRACHQFDYAETLSKITVLNGNSTGILKKNNHSFLSILKINILYTRIVCIDKLNILFDKLQVPSGRRGLPSITILDYFFRLLKWVKLLLAKNYIFKIKY